MGKHEILFLAVSYLLGSIPFGFIYFYLTEKKDIREKGSGNIGATNILRNKGKIAGVITLLFDISKGVLPIVYGSMHFDDKRLILLGGVIAIFAHIFPVWLKFKGGKGVAAFLGTYAAYYYPSIVLFLGVFLVTLYFTRYVSAGSLLGVISIFFLMLFTHSAEIALLTFVIVLVVVVKHRSNIRRISKGMEHKLGQKHE